jgi:hypothetical protein
MSALTQIVVWLNAAANALGQAFGFIAFMPGWLSATLIGFVSGIAMLISFKWTSNQKAFKRTRQDIRASLLTVKLFYDNMPAGFRAQGRVLVGAARMLVLAIVPVLAMIVPMLLLCSQLALWYQARPLQIGEETVIVMKLGGADDAPLPAATLEATSAIADLNGPVRVVSQREICWKIRAREDGLHRLVFQVDGYPVEKELAVGDGFLRVSLRRPNWDWWEALMHPREAAFDSAATVQSIDVEYPARASWTSGTNYWFLYWFAVSMIAFLCCRGIFKVNL